MKPIEQILSKLPGAKRNGTGWQARCPAHDDNNPSLSITETDDGRVLLSCHSGCHIDAVLSAIELTRAHLFPLRNGTHRDHKPVTKTLTVKPVKVFPSANDAVAAYEQALGKRSTHWTYRNDEGEPVGLVIRWDKPDGKDIRPVSRTPAGWIMGGMPEPRPLYCLPELLQRSGERVYVCEGEKAAEAARSVGLLLTTSPHGSKSAAKADWRPLAGRDVVILPDNDGAGQKYAETVAGILTALNPPATVKIVGLPELPDGGDFVEFLAARNGVTSETIRAEVDALANAAEAVKPEPLAAGLIEQYRPFPVDALPEPVRKFVNEASRALPCDPSYIAFPLLTVLAAAIGNTRRIRLKRDWTEPGILWTAIIGCSGTMKSPAFKVALKPTRDLQALKLKEYQATYLQYEQDLLRYEAELMGWKRETAKSKSTAGDPPEKPEVPHAVRYVVSDTTVEALVSILQANPRGVLLARDELAGWIASFDRYAGGKSGADESHWLSMNDGENLTVDRKTGQPRTIFVPSACVSVAGGIQPGILNSVMTPGHHQSGLLARFLLANPPRRMKQWRECGVSSTTEASLRRILDRLYKLKSDADENGDPIPRIITLTDEGQAAWVSYFKTHAAEQFEMDGDLAAAWAKLEKYAARLALIVHCVRVAADDPTLKNPEAIDESSVTAGVKLSRWAGNETKRVYALLAESDKDRDRRRLVELIQRKGGEITERDLQQASRQYRTAEDAETALAELVKAGYGRWESRPPGPRGGRPTRAFRLNKAHACLQNPEDSTVSESSGSVDGVGNSQTTEPDNAPDDDWGEL